MNCNPPPPLLLNRPGIQNDKSPYKYLFWLLTLTPPLRRPGALWPWSSCYSHPSGTRAADMPFPIVIESLNNTFRQMWKLSPIQGEESLDFNFAKCIFIHWGAGAPSFSHLQGVGGNTFNEGGSPDVVLRRKFHWEHVENDGTSGPTSQRNC